MAPNRTTWLTSANEREIGSVRLAANAVLLVGRAGHNHLVLNDYRISRQHARVTHERDGYYVYDLNSVNGTSVNGAKVRRQQLQVGDTVTFGPFAFTIESRIESNASLSIQGPGSRRAESVIQFAAVPAAMLGDDVEAAPAADPVPPVQPQFDLKTLEQAHKHLSTLYAFLQAIGQTIEKNELLELMGGKILEIFPAAASVCVYVREDDDEDEGGGFKLVHYLGSASPSEQMPDISRTAIATGNAIGDASAAGRKSTVMCAPMLDRGKAFGVIFVTAGGREAFSSADISLLGGMAAPATIALKNTRQHEELLNQGRIRRDLALAAQIQMSFLPREVISVGGADFLACYRAAYSVGGDFYDIFWVGPSKLAVFIGDIAGKGIAAALLMARITGELRIAALAHVDPVQVLMIMNQAVLDRHQPELFFTAAYLTLDLVTGEVLLASGGHPSPFLCRANGDVSPILEGGSTAVGMFADPSFAAKRFYLEDCDSLVLYTDGVIEATNRWQTLFGVERLYECLLGVGSFPDDITTAVLRGVEEFVGKAEANDDLTLFICQRAVGASPAMQPRIHEADEAARPTYESYETMEHDPLATLPPPAHLTDPTIGADTVMRRPTR